MNIVLYIVTACACLMLIACLISTIILSHGLVKTSKKNETREISQKENNDNDNLPDIDVAFATHKLTHQQKYLALSTEARKYYDEIIKYVEGIDGNKCYKNEKYEEYKIGNKQLVKIKIKNETIICELLIPSIATKDDADDNKKGVRQSATVVKVTDEPSLNAAKHYIDIVVTEIKKEREEKEEKNKLRRREHYKKSKMIEGDDKLSHS